MSAFMIIKFSGYVAKNLAFLQNWWKTSQLRSLGVISKLIITQKAIIVV